MKAEKTETIEVSTVSAKLGTISEHDGKLFIQLATCKLVISRNEIQIGFNVARPCHDHGDTAEMTIKGLDFLECECGSHEERRPLVEFSERWRPDLTDPELLLRDALWDIEKKYGKLYGRADLKALGKLLTNDSSKDFGEMAIHAYKLDSSDRNKSCVDIITTTENLALILPLLKFRKERETGGSACP